MQTHQKKATNDQTILNEAWNIEKNTIFIAIPKTGTTSVRNQLKQPGTPLINYPHLNIAQVRDGIYLYLLTQHLGSNRSYPTIHIPSDTELRVQASTIFKTCFKFSAVRNPWARAVSIYCRTEGVIVNKKFSFKKFLENHFHASDTCLNPTLHTNQLDWLSDESGNNLMDYVYKLENFSAAIRDIHDLTKGRIALRNLTENKNPKSFSAGYREYYDDEGKKMISKRFEKDIDYFKYSF